MVRKSRGSIYLVWLPLETKYKRLTAFCTLFTIYNLSISKAEELLQDCDPVSDPQRKRALAPSSYFMLFIYNIFFTANSQKHLFPHLCLYRI